ncbi:MAG: hypothetical protein M3032_02145, partial [Verrucomicrobiota bacterium]|nr:hypothetical protein [Verrucomicrobiota bacterium]
MSEPESNLRCEIGHVLFIDIVGYSKLLIEEQKERLNQLTAIVLATEQVRESTDEQLVRLPTGDGMALVFRHSVEEPARCAVEVAQALKAHPEMPTRMGVHSGPISDVTDLNSRTNIAGAGINMAQRVMDCGDAGHILLSKHAAEDLEQYGHWQPQLHDLGDCEVKHGVRLGLANLYTDSVGNPRLPKKLQALRQRKRIRWAAAAALLLLAFLAVASFVMLKPAQPMVAAADKSIAVLPFENLSSDKENAYFADGVQDEILTNLARIAELKVISRTSVMQYKTGAQRKMREIGRQLGVAHLLEGSVQRAANRVRVNAQLIDARTDAHLWAQTYDRDLADVFAIQSEIAKAIADQLQAKLSPNEKAAIERPPTTDLAAFDLYSRARTLVLATSFSSAGEENLRQAIELLDEAVVRDPAFFEAYCQLADAHGLLYSIGVDHTAARLASAEAALEAAIRLRPDAGETHLARAQYLYSGRREYAAALAELEIARQTLPNDPRIFEWTGYILRRRGEVEEGLRNLEKAIELDPRNYYIMQQIAATYRDQRRYREEATLLDRALTIIPNDVPTKVARALVEFEAKADTVPLHREIDSILAANPGAISDAADNWLLCALAERNPVTAERALSALGNRPWWAEGAVLLSRSFGEGLVARMMNDEARARAAFEKARAEQEQIVQTQPAYAPPLCVLGLIDAALGNKASALEEGRRAIELLPVAKDAGNGSRMLQFFAVTAAWTGDKELALQQLEISARAPVASLAFNYGALKLLPFWDPL